MKFIPRQDRVLLVGLAATLLVVFARSIRYLLDLAYQVEQTSGLALIPGLIILTVVFLFHQQAKRQETKARTAALEADAFQAELRAAEMERLVLFGQALGRSLDFDALRDVVSQHLPRLAESDDAWIMTWFDGRWEPLTTLPREGRREHELRRQQIADRALSKDRASHRAEPVVIDDHVCQPMAALGQVVGVLAIPESAAPLTEGAGVCSAQHQLCSAARSVTRISFTKCARTVCATISQGATPDRMRWR